MRVNRNAIRAALCVIIIPSSPIRYGQSVVEMLCGSAARTHRLAIRTGCSRVGCVWSWLTLLKLLDAVKDYSRFVFLEQVQE